MSTQDLINAVKANDLPLVRQLLDEGTDVNQQDEHGWTALNWAAGQGNLEVVTLLVQREANLFKTGTDQRTPYLIALAAGREQVARFLHRTEKEKNLADSPNRHDREYCKAYYLRQLRQFPAWTENPPQRKPPSTEQPDDKDQTNEESRLTDDSIVFIHHDYSVTASIWHDEDVLFKSRKPEWKTFCEQGLGFRVPDDFDLMVSDHELEAAVKTEEENAPATDGQ